MKALPLFAAVLTAAFLPLAGAATFHTDFEGGSLGKTEPLTAGHYRVHVEGQSNEQGRNRQPTWYYFQVREAVAGQPLKLTLTEFLGEYNFKPACAMNAQLRPMFSYDGKQWEHLTEAQWDDERKEMTVVLTPTAATFYVAHIQPYVHSRCLALVEELRGRPDVKVEVIGQGSLGRPLHLLTVTDGSVADAEKKCLWLQARQHAWEAGTSYVMEGALRFITSDDPEAQALRRKFVFKFTPMVDPDGVAKGKVRFNAQGYDVNRHWPTVDITSETDRKRMPEIWHTKTALVAAHRQKPIDLMVNMHNTETAEYLDSAVDAEPYLGRFTRLFGILRDATGFDPSRLPILGETAKGTGSTNDLWVTERIPVALMELRIGPSKKLQRYPTADDRLKFGPELLRAMAQAVE